MTPPDNDAAKGSKVCYTCRVSKDYSKYGKNKRKADGLAYNCLDCERKRGKDYYKRTSKTEHQIRRHEEYRKTHMESIRTAHRKRMKDTYETQGRARAAVRAAIISGKLVSQACEVCSKPRADFHHANGYDKKNYLVGKWLCRVHHAAVHARIREEKQIYNPELRKWVFVGEDTYGK